MKLNRIFTFLLVACFANPVFTLTAQETDQAQKEARESTPSSDPKLESEDKKKRADAPVSKNKPPKEVFNPTEEISEDSPVPFPVDI